MSGTRITDGLLAFSASFTTATAMAQDSTAVINSVDVHPPTDPIVTQVLIPVLTGVLVPFLKELFMGWREKRKKRRAEKEATAVK
jgi:antibiotic biosynthesis monooxygenase (ABM) superfamily enzyme